MWGIAEVSVVVCFRSWRTAWFSHWLDVSSLPTVGDNFKKQCFEEVIIAVDTV